MLKRLPCVRNELREGDTILFERIINVSKGDL